MAKYKGSVELIAGITQKNKEAGNNFALVDAADIQVDDRGKRLNERLDELAAVIGTGNGAPVELSNYYNRTEADKKFATAEALKSYYTKTEADARFETKGALSYYYTKTQAEEKFAKKTDVAGFAKTSDLESLSSALGTLSEDYEYLNSRHASTAAKLQIAENTVAEHETRLHNLERVQGTGGQEFDLSDYYTKDEADEKYASRDEIDNLLAGGADLTQYAKIETVEDHEARISELEALGGVTFDTAEFEDLSTDDKTIIGAINEVATDAFLSFSKATKNEGEISNIKSGSVEVGRAKAATNDAVGRAIHETYATKDELDAVVSGGADLTQYTKTADFLNGTVEVQRAQRATYDAEGNLIHGTYATHTDLAEAVAEAVAGLPQLSQDVGALKWSNQVNTESLENHEERIKTLEGNGGASVDTVRAAKGVIGGAYRTVVSVGGSEDTGYYAAKITEGETGLYVAVVTDKTTTPWTSYVGFVYITNTNTNARGSYICTMTYDWITGNGIAGEVRLSYSAEDKAIVLEVDNFTRKVKRADMTLGGVQRIRIFES